MRILRTPQSILPAGWLWAGIVLLALTACGTHEALPSSTLLETTAAPSHAFIATVAITEADTPETIAADYGADVVVWRPEANFAILGMHGGTYEADTLGRPGAHPARPARPLPDNAAPNRGTFTVPVFDEATALSVNAWAGGVNAWAGGVNAWAGGAHAWAGGSTNPFPGNEEYWSQIRLGDAQDVATNLGADISIAVIDTGIDLNHSAFTDRLTPSSTWRDFVDGNDDPHEGYVTGCTLMRGKACHETGPVRTGDGDFFGHGTAVAGVALQAAPGATIMPIRVLNSDGFGSATHVAMAIDHAITHGAHVINLSLGTFERVEAIDQMLAFAGQQGVVVVAASGNTGTETVMFPAATAAGPDFPRAISVGSVDAHDAKSEFSSYGLLETLAPGEGINTLYPGDATVSAVGTSFSTPWVSGAVALILGDGGEIHQNIVVKAVGASDGIDHLNSSWVGLLGDGRLNVREAVRAAIDR